jgi:hypothetical protein
MNRFPKRPSGWRLVLISAIALVSVSPAVAQTRRPIDLSRLEEKDVWEAVDRASADDVFLVRGQRIDAATLKRRVERMRSAAPERQRQALAALPDEPSQLAQQLLRTQRLHENWVNAQQEALGAKRLAELEREYAPASREVRAAREEAIRLAARYRRATSAEERDRLKTELTDIAERLRRLGSPIDTELDCDR